MKLQTFISQIPPEVINQNRQPEVVKKRAEVIITLRNYYTLTFQEIGRIIKRDHGSVMNLYYKHNDNEELARELSNKMRRRGFWLLNQKPKKKKPNNKTQETFYKRYGRLPSPKEEKQFAESFKHSISKFFRSK